MKDVSLKSSLLLLLSLFLFSCQWAGEDTAKLTLGMGASDRSIMLQRAAIDEVYPSLQTILLSVSTASLTIEDINDQYNNGAFTLNSERTAFVLNDTVVELVVPNTEPLNVVITAINTAGFQVFSGEVEISIEDLAEPALAVAVPLVVDIDTEIPILASVSDCTDSDSDDLCDVYEDLFLNAEGVADIDGDGQLNRNDPDADGDSVPDDADRNSSLTEGNLPTPSNDGYPMFIVASRNPSVADVEITTSENQAATLVLPSNEVDPDVNDDVDYLVATTPENGTVEIVDDTIIYTPNNFFVGVDTFSISATDLRLRYISETESFNVSMNVVDNPSIENAIPVIESQTSLSMQEDSSLTLSINDLTIINPDGDSLSLLINSGSNYSVDGLTITPAVDFNGALTVPVLVNDGTDDSAVFNMSVDVTAVNDPPQITAQNTLITNEDTDLILTLDDLTIVDVDDAVFTLTINSGGNYTASGTTITPAADFNGTLSVPVLVNDGTDDSAVFDLSVDVTAVNDLPQITAQSTLTTDEDTNITLTLSDITVVDVDDSVFSLTVNSGSNYTVSGTTITPAADFNGTLTVPMFVNDGADDSSIYNATVDVTAVNDLPQITAQSSLTTDEDTNITLTLSDITIVDVDDSVFSLTVNNGSNYTVSGTTITPAADFNGTLSVPVLVNDGTDDSAVFDLSVDVTAVNDLPQITAQSTLTTDEDTNITLTLSDITVVDVDDSVFSLTVNNGSNYTVSGTTITPSANFNGTLTVPLFVNDGADDSSIYNATVDVTSVNDAPVAGNPSDVFSTAGAALSLDVMSFASDPDIGMGAGDTLELVSAQTSLGAVALSKDRQTIYYVSNRLSSGSETISYTLQDTSGVQDSSSVQVDFYTDNDGDGISSDAPGQPINGTLVVDSDDANADADGDGFSDYYELTTNVTVSPTNNWTDVTADINVDTVWTIAGSPYMIADQAIRVTGDIELRIEQGVEVKFTGSSSQLQIVNGAVLNVLGGNTDALKVRFTSLNDDTRQPVTTSSSTPNSSDWAQFEISNDAEAFVQGLQLLYSDAGLNVGSGSTQIRNVEIERNTNTGLVINVTSGFLSVSDSLFAANRQGVTVKELASDSEITNSLILGNSDGDASNNGGGLSVGDTITGRLTLSNSLVADNHASNFGGGVYVGADSVVNVYGSSLLENRVDGYSNGGGAYALSGTNNITFIDSVIAYNDCGDGCPEDIAQGTAGAVNTAGSIYNATDETQGQGSAFTDASNLFGSSPNYENGFYLLQTDPLVTTGGSTSTAVMPSYLARLPLATTAKDGVADSGQVDIGFHYSSGVNTNVSGTSLSTTNFQSTSTAVSSQLVVTPKDGFGNTLGPLTAVTMDTSSVFFNNQKLGYIGDGQFELAFTMPVEDNCSNPASETLNVYVNGVTVGSVDFSYWTAGC